MRFLCVSNTLFKSPTSPQIPGQVLVEPVAQGAAILLALDQRHAARGAGARRRTCEDSAGALVRGLQVQQLAPAHGRGLRPSPTWPNNPSWRPGFMSSRNSTGSGGGASARGFG